MNDSAIYLQPGFILRQHHYRESSLILTVLTRDYGIIAIFAKGARRKRSKSAGLLLPFTGLKLSFVGQSGLKTLTGAELSEQFELAGLGLYCGFYVNELVCNLLHEYDPHPEVYSEYRQCITQLTNSIDIEQNLRFFELKLMNYVGYGLTLDVDAEDGQAVDKEAHYRYREGIGMVRRSNGLISGQTLLALKNGQIVDKQNLKEAKQLMRAVLDYHLQGKTFKSRKVLAEIIKYMN